MQSEGREPTLPGWAFSVSEISAGVYEVVSTRHDGVSFRAVGTDPVELIETAKREAATLDEGTAETPIRKGH